MVLYLDALRSNIEDYLRLTGLIERFLEGDDGLHSDLLEAQRTANLNLGVIEGLLAGGMTELSVDHTTR